MNEKQKVRFEALRDTTLKTAQAWAIKDLASQLWDARGGCPWVEQAWQKWMDWAQGCQLPPVCKAVQTVKEHLWGIVNAIVNAIVTHQSNGRAESVNSKIQHIKRRACGFRNAIY